MPAIDKCWLKNVTLLYWSGLVCQLMRGREVSPHGAEKRKHRGNIKLLILCVYLLSHSWISGSETHFGVGFRMVADPSYNPRASPFDELGMRLKRPLNPNCHLVTMPKENTAADRLKCFCGYNTTRQCKQIAKITIPNRGMTAWLDKP